MTGHIPIKSYMKLYVKYMVSLRCKMMVKEELKKLGLHYVIIDLGMVEILEDIPDAQRESLRVNLLASGLVLLDNKKSILIEKIKSVIIDLIHYSDEMPKMNYSDYISEKLGYDYTYLANIFSEVKGITIQQFSEPAGGQVVFHLHMHVMPRHDGVALLPPASRKEDLKVLEDHATRIIAALG